MKNSNSVHRLLVLSSLFLFCFSLFSCEKKEMEPEKSPIVAEGPIKDKEVVLLP